MASSPILKKAIFSLVLLSVGLVLALALAEVVLRLSPNLLPPERRQYLEVDLNNVGVADPDTGHLHTPNSVGKLAGPDFTATHHTDTHGFRNHLPWPTHADVVVLGDSLVFGYGVDDAAAWPAQLGQHLDGVRVMNLGLIGAGPEQYLRVYRKFGAPLRPHLVVLGFFPDNDFWDAEMFDRWQRSGADGNYMVWRNYGRRAKNPFRDPVNVAKGWLVRKSYLYNLVVATAQAYRVRSSGEPKVLQLKDGSSVRLMPSGYLKRTEGAKPGHRTFKLVTDAIRQLDQEVRRSGSNLLVVIQPGKEQVYLPLTGESVSDPADGVKDELRRLGIQYLDLTPVFQQQAAAGVTLFFESDGHPNAKGYRLIADRVFGHIAARAAVYGLPVGQFPTAASLPERKELGE